MIAIRNLYTSRERMSAITKWHLLFCSRPRSFANNEPWLASKIPVDDLNIYVLLKKTKKKTTTLFSRLVSKGTTDQIRDRPASNTQLCGHEYFVHPKPVEINQNNTASIILANRSISLYALSIMVVGLLLLTWAAQLCTPIVTLCQSANDENHTLYL